MNERKICVHSRDEMRVNKREEKQRIECGSFCKRQHGH